MQIRLGFHADVNVVFYKEIYTYVRLIWVKYKYLVIQGILVKHIFVAVNDKIFFYLCNDFAKCSSNR